MKLTPARVFFCACAALATNAPGQTVSVWTGSAGDGQWATAGNWNPSGEPVAPNQAIVNINSTISLPTTSVGGLFLESSTINLNVSGATFTANNISIDSGATVNLVIAGGSVISANSVSPNASTFVGDGNGTGTLNLSGSGSMNFTSAVLGSGVGIGGTGVFNQSGSTTVNVTAAGQNGFFVIGADGNVSIPSSLPPGSQTALGGVGTYTISGNATLTADSVAIGVGSGLGGGNTTGGSTATTGLLNINGGNVNITDLVLGAGAPVITDAVSNVSGSVNQTAGVAVVSDDLDIGVAAGATANYALSGGTLTVGTDLNIGGMGAAGSMTLSGNASLTDNGTFEIGSAAGTGTFTFAGGTLTTQGIAVGSNGVFNQDASFTPTLASNPITLTHGTYNLNSGTISLAGSTGAGTSAIHGTGNFNFAGGTVVTTAAWTDMLNSAFSGTSGLNATAGAAALTGVLTGSGTLDITGGTVNLIGVGNSGTWGATLTNGSTLHATNINSLSTSGSYAIGSGSTLNVGATGNAVDTFNGNVSDFADVAGMSTFNLTGFTNANKLVLAGTTALSVNSATNIGAGTLEVDHGTISNVTGTNATDTLDIGGTAVGSVTLLGLNTLPMVTINGGSTLFAGNSTAGATAITGRVNNMGGTLGTLGSLTTPAALLIGGSLTSTGTLLVNSNGIAVDTYGSAAHPLTSATLSGLVNVKGIGTITNVPIVFTTGGVTATLGTAPGDLMTNTPTPLFSATLSIVGTNLDLSTTQNFVTGFAQTPNQVSVGHSIDFVLANGVPYPTAFIPVITAFDSLGAQQIPVALEQLTPESLQYSRNIAFENSTFLATKMNGIDANLRNGVGGLDTNAISIVSPGFESGLGRSLGSMLASNAPYRVAGPIGADFYPGDEPASTSPYAATSSKRNVSAPSGSGETISDSPAHDATYQTGQHAPDWSGMSEFIGGDVILADLNKDTSAANAPSSKANYTAGDATAGVSFRVTSHLQAGILFDYNHTDAKTDANGSRTKVDTYSPGVFATYSDHGFYANGLFTYGYNEYSNHRDIGFLNETAASKPNGEQYTGDLDFGYDFHPDKQWIAGPTLGVTYTHLTVDSFTETGAPGANLSVQDQDVDSIRSRVGHLIYQTQVNYVLLQPNISAVWQHEYLDNSTSITSSFSDFNTTPFTIQAASVNRDSALLGAGLTASFSDVISLSLNYSADVNTGDYFAQTVMFGFNARF